MDIVISRYQPFLGSSTGPYIYFAKIGTVSLESPNILDLELFIGMTGHTTKLSFINEDEYK